MNAIVVRRRAGRQGGRGPTFGQRVVPERAAAPIPLGRRGGIVPSTRVLWTGTIGPWPPRDLRAVGRNPPGSLFSASPMTSALRLFAVAFVAAAVITASSAPPSAASRPAAVKATPHRVTPYEVGRPVTPDTNIRSTSGYAAWMIDEFLAAQTPLPPLGPAFITAEQTDGVNARILLAIAILESGYGNSLIARSKRNLFGYHAYDRDPFRYASHYRTYQASIEAVAGALKTDYLSPSGRFWGGLPTLRGVNLAYASDVRWAQKIAYLANAIDASITTLRERGILFGGPQIRGRLVAQSKATVTVAWHGRSGVKLPAGLRFAARWTPIAVAENDIASPPAPPPPAWALVAGDKRSVTRGSGTTTLTVTTPALPGLWRLDLDPRDAGGGLLPVTDHPTIASIVVRVAAPAEATLGLGISTDGQLVASVTASGRTAIGGPAPAAAASLLKPSITTPILEAWSLPLDPSLPSTQLAGVSMPAVLPPGRTVTAEFAAPATPGVVVVRLGGEVPEGVHAVPAVMLVTQKGDGTLALSPLPVTDPRTISMASASAAKGAPVAPSTGLAIAPGSAPGAAGILVPDALAAASPPTVGELANPAPEVLLRTLDAVAGRPADPTDDQLAIDAATSGAGAIATGLPTGLRLAVVALVPADAASADPRTLVATWLPVLAASSEMAPN